MGKYEEGDTIATDQMVLRGNYRVYDLDGKWLQGEFRGLRRSVGSVEMQWGAWSMFIADGMVDEVYPVSEVDDWGSA